MSIAPSIFVSIVSYCDPMLSFTLNSARAQASDPDRVFFGVVEQDFVGTTQRPRDEWALRHLRWTRVDAMQARGPCWARSLAMALYQGEDWYLQVDSHTWFEPGWDDRLLRWSHHAASHNPRHVISGYPNPFEMRNGLPVAQPVTNRVLAFVLRPGAVFADEHPVLVFEGVPVEVDHLVPARHVAGGCLFAPGRIVDELPYDPRLYFHGEEQALALRAWTRGWDLFQMPGLPMYHLYTRPGTTPRLMHWSPAQDSLRAVGSSALELASRRRLSALFWEGQDLGAYGLGEARSLADYAAFSGIDYAARTIAPLASRPASPLDEPAQGLPPCLS